MNRSLFRKNLDGRYGKRSQNKKSKILSLLIGGQRLVYKNIVEL